ncbi:MAG: twin-arginine translocase subunit TatB [Moraxellaceae bacterium]|nr:MAG: twin-arginine translocase subunit TatB [Moraxellaceae bacterium]
MFGIDFSEFMVCFVVALVVLGPERLPEAVRTTSLWIGRMKRSLRETKEEIERQVGVDDIRRQLHTEEMMRTLDQMHDEIESALNYERMGKPAQKIVPLTHEVTTIENNHALVTPAEANPDPYHLAIPETNHPK